MERAAPAYRRHGGGQMLDLAGEGRSATREPWTRAPPAIEENGALLRYGCIAVRSSARATHAKGIFRRSTIRSRAGEAFPDRRRSARRRGRCGSDSASPRARTRRWARPLSLPVGIEGARQAARARSLGAGRQRGVDPAISRRRVLQAARALRSPSARKLTVRWTCIDQRRSVLVASADGRGRCA